ncbi:MAG: glycosyltransferase, partial [Verrucomicrobiaceae bacterium]|nr:glycosyltransferase [Verrucomicrobiaceae bacterium]
MSAPLPSLILLIRDLGFGGAQRQLVTLAKGLHLTHFQITVVSFYGGPLASDLASAGIPHLSIGKKHRWDLLGFIARLARTLRSLKPDFIHSFLAESNLMALLMKPLCGFPKVIWGIRDSESDAHQWGLLGKASFRLNCLLSPFADQIIANSETGRRWYQNHGFPNDDTRFVVVPNGIDTARFIPKPDLTPQDTVLGIIGRLNPMKDHPTFIRAAALVHQTHPHVRFQIIGDGPANYLAELQTQAQNLPISFHPACTDPENTYPRLTALISSSAYGEGFSNVLGEALACGTPAIATNVGDAALVLGDTGYLAPPRDPAALAASIRQFLDLPPETRTTLPQRCRQHIEQNFTLPHLHTRTAKVVQASSLHDPVERAAGSPPPKVPRLSEASPKTGAAALPNVVQASCLHSSPILWITTGLGSGGAEMMLTQLIQNLPHHRHTVLSLTSGGKHIPTLQSAGATVLSLDMPAGKPTPRALLRLLKIAWQIRPAVIMGWMYHGCLAAALVKLFRLGNGRLIWNIRQSLYDLALEKRGSALVIQSLRWFATLARVITYNSQLSARQHEAIGYPATKTQLIPNGFDLTKWSPSKKPLRPSNLCGEKLRIGRFGRFTPMKDYPTFLQAAALITQKIPHTEFHLAGSGIDSTNTDLTQLIADLHLQNHVHLHGDHPDIPALTASLDLAISSSAFGEGFPNVVGEAMACAVPVVATDIGDTAWVMGDTGNLVPPRDPQALATAALKILSLPAAERQTLGHQARTRIESHFSLPSILTHFDTLLTSPQSSASFQLARPVGQAAGLPASPPATEPVDPHPSSPAPPVERAAGSPPNKVVQASCLHSPVAQP